VRISAFMTAVETNLVFRDLEKLTGWIMPNLAMSIVTLGSTRQIDIALSSWRG